MAFLEPTAVAQTAVPGGQIINQTWTAAGSPYQVAGDVVVPVGSTLTFEAGVRVEFSTTDSIGNDRTELRVEGGTLLAQGTSMSPIVLTSAGTVPVPGDRGAAWVNLSIRKIRCALSHPDRRSPSNDAERTSPGSGWLALRFPRVNSRAIPAVV